MTSKSVLAAIVEHALSQEPCASCQVTDEWRGMWSVKLPSSFKCGIDEKYPCCPWTGYRFPWTQIAGVIFVDYDDKEGGDD